MITCPPPFRLDNRSRPKSIDTLPRSSRWAPLAALVLVVVLSPLVFARVVGAQSLLAAGSDASVVPRGVFRLRALTEWERYDELFDRSLHGIRDHRQLGTSLASDQLGVQQFPALAATQNALRALTGDITTTLSLGKFTAASNARVVVVPMILEYGVTSRIALGVNVPFVQTRTTLVVELNHTPGGGNVGVNTGFTGTSTQVFNDFTTASQHITQALASCATNPAQPICSRQAEASALHDATLSFAEAVALLYGTNTFSGQPFVPRAGALLDAINQHRLDLNGRYASLGLGTIGTTALEGSNVTVALDELQGFLRAQGQSIGRDSLGTIDRVSIGDVEVMATVKLFDGFQDTSKARSGGVRSRASLRGLVRFPTAIPQLTGLPGEILTGGRFDVEGKAALDIRASRRFAASLGLQGTLPIGERSVLFVANPFDAWAAPTNIPGTWKPTNLIIATAEPHLMLGGFFSFDGHYAFIRRGGESYTFGAPPDSNSLLAPNFGTGFAREGSYENRVGFGFSYSSVSQYLRGRMPVPIEMSYVHMESLAASGGLAPKFTTDQVQVRIYYKR